MALDKRRHGEEPTGGEVEESDSETEEVSLPEPQKKKSKLAATPLEIAHHDSGRKSNSNQIQHPIIVLLDQASLETIKNKKNIYELLNCDDHRDLCRKKLRRDPNDFRPDILHSELLALLDSPLNKAGLLKIYIQTQKRVLIDVHPSIRIPRTFKRFSGLMVQLLHKMKIRAGNDSTILLKVIKNPFSQYLPAGTRCYGMSCKGKLYSPAALVQSIADTAPGEHPICCIVGAMSTGHVKLDDHPYMEEMFSISEYPLSGAAALSRILGAIENQWGIV